MAAALEEILGRLLLPDSSAIQQATRDLKVLYKDPGLLSGLCQILGNSQNPQVRQYAAILLRKKLLKVKVWNSLQGDVAQNIRENILQLLLQEPDKNVRNGVAQVVATVAKHDLPSNRWPQLFQFITMHVKSQEPNHREIGMFVLHSVASAAAEQLQPHLMEMIQLIAVILSDQQSSLAPFYAIKTLSEVIFIVGDQELKAVQQLVPHLLLVIKNLITVDQEKACEAFEVFDEMLECEVVVITPHIKAMVQVCLELAANTDLDGAIRVKAMSFITSLTSLKKKQILKHNLVQPILSVMFPIMSCIDDGEEEDEEEEEDVESQRPSHIASQVIDSMALHLPPEKFIPQLMSLVEPSLTDEKPERRKAGFTAMAVVVEGCADYITNKYLPGVLQCVCKGLSDPNQHVRNSALFAIGQFSEHLQPDISKYASEVLPLLFQYLLQASQEAEKNPKGLTRSYYALEMFCQNLGKDIEPYLPNLMEHLLTVLRTSPALRPKELAISAIGATASAAEKLINPYFEQIIEQFRVYLGAGDSEEMFKLQLQTIDTLGVLARCVGADVFNPLTKESIQFGLNLLNTAEDPDQRRCIYGLFAAISTLLKSEMAIYLPTMMHYMLLSLKTTEGVKAHVKEEKALLFEDQEFDDEVDLEEEEESGDVGNIEGISVENSYMEEKEDTATALGEIAVNAELAFMPYLEESYEELLQLLEYPASRVKRGTITALGQYCCCVHSVEKSAASPESRQTALVARTSMLNTLVPKFLTLIADEPDRVVVMTTVDVIHEILEKIGQPVLEVPDAADQILVKMKLIFSHKVACQEEEEEEEEEQEAEYDGMLIESAGDVIPIMAKLLGGQNFQTFLAGFLPDLLKRMRQTSSVAEKSFAVGTLGETVEAIGQHALIFSDLLYPLFMKMVKEEDDEVRSNSVYSLGVLAFHCCDKLQGHYTDILKALFEVLNKESNGLVIDNVCAAVCRMIMAKKTAVPLEHVVPVVVKCLPLKEDQEENITVYKCLTQLYAADNQEVIKLISNIVNAIAVSLGTEGIKSECESLMIQFVKDVHQRYPTNFNDTRSLLPPEHVAKLDRCLSVVNGNRLNGTS